ncbi:MAG: protein kinase [Sandaracinaceae bacterium]|nr:protein kinase [Sandaracinaceae bacterium]
MGLPPTIPERFRVVRTLGEGGMGVVYEAFDKERGVTVALKTLRDAHGDAVYRLKREFRALQGVEHPNLVRLYDLFAEGSSCFYTMELIPGRELGAAGGARPVLDAGDATVRDDDTDAERFEHIRQVLDGLCRGLEALHAAGLLHRDLKPSNVMVEDSGRVVLLDFGLVADAHAAAQQTVAGAVAGTVAYMAPEQARGEVELTAAVDRYAVGVILFELLTGTQPFRGGPYAVLADKVSEDAPRAKDFVASVPADLDELAAKLLSRDPVARPSLASIRAVLGRVSTDRRVVSSATSNRAAPALVGRAGEQQRLLDALRSTAAGSACIALVRGRSGIGKSALIAAVTREADTRERALVLTGRCHEFETVPFKGLDGVIDSLSRYLKAASAEQLGQLLPPDLGDLATIFPVLRRIPPIASAYARRATTERTVQRIRSAGLACLRELLRRIGESTPLLVVIDDVQWADEDTSRALVELLRDQHPPAMMLLLGSRPDDTTPVIEELFGAGSRRATIEAVRVTVELEPLDHAATTELLRAELRTSGHDGSAHEQLVNALAREAQGNPFAACELARFVRDEAGEFSASVAGRSIDDIVVERAEALDPAARGLLDVIAVSGEPTDERVLRRAAGLSPDDRASTDALRAKLWIRSLRSGSATHLDAVHDRVRESIAQALPKARSVAIHHALALALEGTESPAHDRLARHFAAAGDRSLAHHHALVAADEARAALALRRASELLGLAVESATDAQRAALMPRYAEALAEASLFERCAEAWDKAADLAAGPERHERRRRAAEAWLYAGRIDHGLELFDRIVGTTGLRPSSNRYIALTQTLWARFRLRLRGFTSQPRPVSEIPAHQIELLKTLRAMTIAYFPLDVIVGGMIHARWLRAALNAGHVEDATLALAMEGCIASTKSSRAGRDRAVEALIQFPAVANWAPEGVWRLCIDTMWSGLNEGSQIGEARSLRLLQVAEANGVPPTYRSLMYYTIAFCLVRTLSYARHEPRIRFVQRREEEAGPFGEVRGRAFDSYYHLLRGDPELALERSGKDVWEKAFKRPTMLRAAARKSEAWVRLYMADPDGALEVALDALRITHATWTHLIPVAHGEVLVRLCSAALAAKRPTVVFAHAKRLNRCVSPAHHGYRVHLEALSALAGKGDPDAKLDAMAEFGSKYRMECLEGAALWGLGTLHPGANGESYRARLLELIADTGLVDPDRFFWSLLPIGDPPPRRGSTAAIWSDAEHSPAP